VWCKLRGEYVTPPPVVVSPAVEACEHGVAEVVKLSLWALISGGRDGTRGRMGGG
jgi:hypothetical protein